MKDDMAEEQRARVMVAYARWGPPLGLGWQRKVSFAWYRGPIPDYERAAMMVDADWQYKTATIRVDLTRVADLDDDDVEWAIVHEIFHIFLDGLITAHSKQLSGDAFRLVEEHTASSLAQSVLWLRAHCEPKHEEDAQPSELLTDLHGREHVRELKEGRACSRQRDAV